MKNNNKLLLSDVINKYKNKYLYVNVPEILYNVDILNILRKNNIFDDYSIFTKLFNVYTHLENKDEFDILGKIDDINEYVKKGEHLFKLIKSNNQYELKCVSWNDLLYNKEIANFVLHDEYININSLLNEIQHKNKNEPVNLHDLNVDTNKLMCKINKEDNIMSYDRFAAIQNNQLKSINIEELNNIINTCNIKKLITLNMVKNTPISMPFKFKSGEIVKINDFNNDTTLSDIVSPKYNISNIRISKLTYGELINLLGNN